MSFKLSALAKTDLREIYIYSLREFGEQHADKYLNSLYAIFNTIDRNPEIGMSPEFPTPVGMRKFPALRHVIYYVNTPGLIEVRRVFHGSREIADTDIRLLQ